MLGTLFSHVMHTSAMRMSGYVSPQTESQPRVAMREITMHRITPTHMQAWIERSKALKEGFVCKIEKSTRPDDPLRTCMIIRCTTSVQAHLPLPERPGWHQCTISPSSIILAHPALLSMNSFLSVVLGSQFQKICGHADRVTVYQNSTHVNAPLSSQSASTRIKSCEAKQSLV
jgi:hypothetical protein